MIKIKFKTKVSLIKGQLSAKRRRKRKKRGNTSKSQEQEENKGKSSKQGKDKAISRRLLSYLEFSSHIKGKSMNFGSLFIALKSLYTRPFYALEKPYKIPVISVIIRYL